MLYNSLSSLITRDPILTEFALGYMNAEGVAQFIAPTVNVDSISGSVVQFGKESFAADNFFRAPGTPISRTTETFTTTQFSLRQEARGWMVTEEQDAMAANGAAKLDLRRLAVLNKAEQLYQSWEVQIAQKVQNPAIYEAECVVDLPSAEAWNKPTSDPEVIMDDLGSRIAAQVGVRPNRLLLSERDFLALKRNKRLREFAQRGTIVNEELLAKFFDLQEVRVSRRRVLNRTTGALEPMYTSSILFYNPTTVAPGFMPSPDADLGRPAAFYTYQMGEIISTPERFDENIRSYIGDLIVWRGVQQVGLGVNGLVGAAVLIRSAVQA